MPSNTCPIRAPASLRESTLGFSLVELMVTVVILGVLLGLAIPGFRYINNSSRITAPANELVASVQIARAEAVRRNARVVLCNSADGASCTAASTWTGWIVFADADRDATVDVGEVVLSNYRVAPPATVQSSAAVTNAALVFGSDGRARNTAGGLLQGVVRICVATTLPNDNVRDVAIGTGGSRLRIERRSAAACAAPGNS